MKLFNVVIPYLAMAFNLYAFLKAYSATTNNKFKINIVRVLIFLCSALVIYIANNFTNVPFKVMTSLTVLMITYKVFYKEDFTTLLFKTFIIYLVILFCDFLASTVFLFFPVSSVGDLGKLSILRVLCTILDSLLLMLIFLFKGFVSFLNKFLKYVTNNKSIVILSVLIFSFFVFFLLSLYTSLSFDKNTFFISIVTMSFFLVLCVIMIFQYFKNKHSEEEQKSLLDLMAEYETILDNDRINRHEMLNNLIVLKSFDNKASKEYEETLNEIINEYQDKKSGFYSKLYKLPSGIKGIIYYKMANIKNLNINLELVISPLIKDNFEKLDSKLYFKVCKILGVVLDNAIEAASMTDEKLLLIDIYLEDEFLVVYLENTFNNNIDLNLIHKKGFSSKGENRGYGLYIVKKMIEETSLLNFNQNIENNRFVTIFKIKNPSK